MRVSSETTLGELSLFLFLSAAQRPLPRAIRDDMTNKKEVWLWYCLVLARLVCKSTDGVAQKKHGLIFDDSFLKDLQINLSNNSIIVHPMAWHAVKSGTSFDPPRTAVNRKIELWRKKVELGHQL